MGLVSPDTITKCLTDKPMLIQKQYSPEEIEGLQKCFVYYVKLPKSRWKDIEKAEANTPEGEKIFQELKQEYTEKYMSPTAPSTKDESHNAADLEYGMEQSS
jgi:glutaredoxin 2